MSRLYEEYSILNVSVTGNGETQGVSLLLDGGAFALNLWCEVQRTDGDYVFTLQISPDGTNWADLAAAGTINSTTVVGRLAAPEEVACARWLRVKCTASSVTTGATISCKVVAQRVGGEM